MLRTHSDENWLAMMVKLLATAMILIMSVLFQARRSSLWPVVLTENNVDSELIVVVFTLCKSACSTCM